LNATPANAQANPLSIQGAGAAPVARTQRESYEKPVLTDAQKEKVQNIVEQNQEQRIRNTPLTKVSKILVRYPKPSTYLKDKKVIPQVSEENIAKYEKMLVQTPENVASFNKIKAAIGKEALPVYLNDKNVKIEGAKVSTPAIGQGKSGDEVLTLTNDQLAGFLVTRVIGRIPNDPIVGVELQSMRRVKKAGRHTDASVKLGKPNVRWVGKAGAFADEATYVETTCEPAKVGNKPETKEGRLRIQESFQIIVGEGTDGKPKVRTIRLSGTVTDLPKFKRKQEYRSALGELSDSQTLSAYLSPEEKADALQKTIDMLSSATASELVGGAGSYGEEFMTMVKSINQANKAQASAAAASFE
jgi:hypothetical protein